MNYSIYYMLTPRCLLNCGYCFRDTSKESLARELSLEDKIRVLKTLVEKLNVRKITLSGGEPTIIGGVVLSQFLSLIAAIRKLKEKFPTLRIELLTNAILLEKDILERLVGVVDRITITIDTIDEKVLDKIGRNTGTYHNYLQRFHQRMIDMHELGFETKIHSVITPVNYDYLEELAHYIKANNHLYNINRWKFYQYMTYDDPIKDAIYQIDDTKFELIQIKLKKILSGTTIDTTFKDNKLMIETMLNLNHDGCFEHVSMVDGKKTKYLSKPAWFYHSIEELVKDINLDLTEFQHYHGYHHE